MKRRIMLAAIAIAACTVTLLGVPLGIVLQQRQSDETVRELTQLAALAAAHVDLEAPSSSRTSGRRAEPVGRCLRC